MYLLLFRVKMILPTQKRKFLDYLSSTYILPDFLEFFYFPLIKRPTFDDEGLFFKPLMT